MVARPEDALVELLGSHGARVEPTSGPVEIAHFGDLTAEHEAVASGCAVYVVRAADRQRWTGADRHRFLNGLVTCDVKELAAGRSVYGLVTSREGRVLADVTVLALEDEIWLELPAGRGEAMEEHLLHHRVADRVVCETLAEWTSITLLGPRAPEVVEQLAGEPVPELGHHREASVGAFQVRVDRRSWLGFDAVVVWVAAGDAGTLIDRLLEIPAARLVGRRAVDAARVAQGSPRFGADYGEDCFPQEAGLGETAVSYTKGCYLGQEVVARIHYRGGVQRELVGVRSGAAVPPRTELHFEGRPVGRLGTVVEGADGSWIGLAIVHHRGANPGTELSLGDGRSVTVVPLPRQQVVDEL